MDQLNETWCNLLHELKFFEDIEDHNLFLRTRWVTSAAEWMSGGHNSKQNDKEICGYSDEEWNYIWSTMLEDGAWAVPSIKDGFGNTRFSSSILLMNYSVISLFLTYCWDKSSFALPII